MNIKLINFNFKNKKVDFWRLAQFAKMKKLNHQEFLKMAFDQNALMDDNKDLLLRFIESFKKIDNFQSQLYQDVLASFIIGNKFEKTFLEFGATDGFNLSNSYLLENSFKWKGVLSEPSPQWHDALIKNRKNAKIITKCIWKKSSEKLSFFMSDVGELSTLKDFIENDKTSIPGNAELRKKSGKTISVETISLNDVVKEYFNNICPSYISIDTEGSEYEILKSFDLDSYRPQLFTIEHNFTQNERKIDEHLINHGYVRIFRKLTLFDAWYIQLENL